MVLLRTAFSGALISSVSQMSKWPAGDFESTKLVSRDTRMVSLAWWWRRQEHNNAITKLHHSLQAG